MRWTIRIWVSTHIRIYLHGNSTSLLLPILKYYEPSVILAAPLSNRKLSPQGPDHHLGILISVAGKYNQRVSHNLQVYHRHIILHRRWCKIQIVSRFL